MAKGYSICHSAAQGWSILGDGALARCSGSQNPPKYSGKPSTKERMSNREDIQEEVQGVIAKVRPTLLPLPSLAAIPALSVSCTEQALTRTDITQEEAYERLNQQEVMVLDVRIREGHHSEHIPDAVPIPLSGLESKRDELNPSDHLGIQQLAL